MTVEPNGVVHLLANIPLNNTYQHTIKFATTEAQYNWFVSKKKYTLTKMTYQRHDSGIMRIQLPADKVYGCNYLMFQNTGFASKWFYAFITSVEYINNTTTEITYELDDMQTWFPFCEMKQCFIERSHTATDVIGSNLVAETVPIGEYVYSGSEPLLPASGWQVAVCGTVRLLYPGEPISGGGEIEKYQWAKYTGFNDFGNMYGGLRINVIDMERIHTKEPDISLEAVVGAVLSGNRRHDSTGEDVGVLSNRVSSVLLFPKSLVSEADSAQTILSKAPSFDKANLFEGYGAQVKNNKLFTYPYSFGRVTTHQGSTADFPLELFRNGRAQFKIACDMSPDPTIIIIPQAYKGVGSNYDEAVYLTDLPFISVATDTYNQWLALNRSQRQANIINTGLGFASQLTTALATSESPQLDIGRAAISSVQTVNSLNAQAEDAKLKAPSIIGGKGSTALFVSGGLSVTWVAGSMRREWAVRADRYFTMFGYAINDVGAPNITSRPHWNYIKVANPVIIGEAPAQAISRISTILTNGITFWHNGDEVGDYSLDNSV